jgi:hypothetical protein
MRSKKTYRRGFFLGPGLPRGLGVPSPGVSVAGADRFVPFFLEPSTRGSVTEGAGVPVTSAAGVAALESDAISPLEMTGAAGVADLAGDSGALGSSMGVSSLMDSGSTSSRSREGVMLSVTTRLGLPPDFRRLSVVLFEGAMFDQN